MTDIPIVSETHVHASCITQPTPFKSYPLSIHEPDGSMERSALGALQHTITITEHFYKSRHFYSLP